IGARPIAAFAAIGTVRDDIIRAARSRGSIDVRIPPGIARHGAALKVRTVPSVKSRGPAYERRKPLFRIGITSGVHEKEVERITEAFNLQAGGLYSCIG